MSFKHQIAIDNLINKVDNEDYALGRDRRRSESDEQILDCIQDYAQQYHEWLKNATTVLELALWNAAENANGRVKVHRRQEGANNDDLGPREESRFNCGAGVIIPLVLPFL